MIEDIKDLRGAPGKIRGNHRPLVAAVVTLGIGAGAATLVNGDNVEPSHQRHSTRIEHVEREHRPSFSAYVLKMQKVMAVLGYYDQEPDGIAGSYTHKKVRLFQKHNNLPQTSTLDAATSQEMMDQYNGMGR